MRRSCGRRSSGCRRSPPAAAARAACGRAPAAAGSRGGRTVARPTARRSGSAVASSVRLVQPNQLARSSSPLTRTSSRPAPPRQPARARPARRRGRRRRPRAPHRARHLRSARGAGRAPIARRHSGATAAGQPLGHARQAVAVARWLAGEQQRPAGGEHALELRERARRGRGCGAARRGRARDRSSRRRTAGCSASAGTVCTSQPQRRALTSSTDSMPGEMSVQVASRDHPGAQQVQREVAGSGADLQRARVASGLPAERLVAPSPAPARSRARRSRCPTWSRSARPRRRGSGC